MTESREERSPDIGGFVRDPRDEIEAIQALLADVYRDPGDGRTLFRELVQNADDAEARRLTLVVLEDGWRDAQNSLLRGPALLVANDGPFPEKDRKALRKAIGGSKKGDVGKIGTFGIGLKSVFHLCEAFLYIGAAQSEWWPGVLNPWYGTGEDGGGDPLFPDWDEVVEEDRQRLRVAAKHLLGETDDGLLLWIPLRRNEHDRGTGGRYWLADRCTGPQEICSWFDSSTSAALLLAQCGHLQSIDTRRATNPETLGDSVTLMSVSRPPSRWLGRYQEESTWFPERRFGGEIASTTSKWSVVGIESLDGTILSNLRDPKDWPQIAVDRNGRHELSPRKARAHAAVTVLRPVETDAHPLGMRLRWAVFLPLDDHPEPSSSAIVESDGTSPAWDIILHGYFWPSQDRRSIPGVTDQEGDHPGDGDIRDRWNRRLCEELLLPLLPRALGEAVEGVDERIARELMEQIVDSDMLRDRRPQVTRQHWLLPVLAQDGVHWAVISVEDADARQVLSLPRWREAPESVRERFSASCREAVDDTLFIEDTAPRLSGDLGDWTVGHIERLLKSIPVSAFESVESLRWVTQVANHILGPDGPEDARGGVFIRWLVQRLGEGALTPTTRQSLASETREELRDEWRNLCKNIPDGWLVETDVDARQAVQELAKCDGVLGKGLFLLPVGRRSGDSEQTLDLDIGQLDRALLELGNLLKAGGESERLRRSRLLLAETLLSVRPERHLPAVLRGLPIFRATRLPDDKDEAWSVADLRLRIENRRVFDRGDKAAVEDLATALDAPVWLVSGDVVVTISADVPTPGPEALADTVLQAREFAEPGSRRPLLHRLVSNTSGSNPNVHLAARALLAGHAADVVGLDTELFQDRGKPRSPLLILLRLLDQSWRAVERRLVGSLPQNNLKALSVSQADLEALHRLLDECLVSQVDWTTLVDDEALILLKHLHSADPALQQRWRKMPLHRYIDGMRGALDDRAVRIRRTASEIDLPPELRDSVRILDPEPEVSHLYDSVPELDDGYILRLMLEDSRPWCFGDRIVRHLRSGDGRPGLPRDSDLRQLLKTIPWLPDRHGQGLAPEAVLIAPKEVLYAVADLAEHGAFGDHRLPDAVDPQTWKTAEPVVREVLGRMCRANQIERLADALDPDRVAQVDGGAWLVMSEPDRVDGSLISCALETTLVGSHRGWKLLHTVRQLLGNGDRQLLEKLARSLCGAVPWVHQIEVLRQLSANRPPKGSAGRHTFRRLLACFSDTNDFFEKVLPSLDLPTQDGNWHAAPGVARTETGVARKHLLVSDLRPALRLTDDDRPPQPSPGGKYKNECALDTLKNYFDPWRNRVPHGAVGAFLSLLGPGLHNTISDLTEEWLGQDLSIDRVHDALKVNSETLSVWISPHVSRGDTVQTANVIGYWVGMEAEPDTDTLFATDPVWYDRQSAGALAPLGPFWQISLRDINPRYRTRSELMQLLGGTVERWVVSYLKLDREQVQNWWREWAEGAQADLLPVLASIKAHLPLTLRQINVGDIEPLQVALREAEQAQRKREQAPSDMTIRRERKSLKHLAQLLEEHRNSVWKRVNQMMRRYGYRPDSVLLELAQNADDALAQATEIKGGPMPSASRRFLVRVDEISNTLTVDVMHWGRTINDTGGPSFPVGRDRQWDQDLYFMMLLNLSNKPGESPREGSLSSTTGRFGLGFKSVHLVSSSPFVVSGFIAFSIAGGLLPVEKAIPEDADSWITDDRRATLVRMPLRTDMDADKLIGSLFDRFSYARVLLPVFARQIREVVVEGGPYPMSHVFDSQPIKAAPGWSIGAEAEVPNHGGRWRILRFRPSDSARSNTGTSALAIGIRDGFPKAFEPEMPFIWNVTPTSENWACGYAVNGPFKLDPGRTHVSLDDETTRQAVSDLGKALGQGLVEMHDALTGEIPAGELLGIHGVDPQDFLSALWNVLASGMNDTDELRSSFLRGLHGGGRGLSAWMAARSVVPTHLPEPFPRLLPPLNPGVSWEVAADGLDDPELCAALAEIDDEDFRELFGSRCIVSAETDQLLAPLLALPEDPPLRPRFAPHDLLASLAAKWNHRLTTKRLHALRPLTRGAAWESISRVPLGAVWHLRMEAQAVDGSYQPLHRLLLRETAALSGESDGDVKEDLLLAGFAPEDRILDSSYIGCPEDWRLFRWLRPQPFVNAAEVATWYRNIDQELRPAALRYLADGRLQEGILSKLNSIGARPSWLRTYHVVRSILQDICDEPWRRQRLLGALFPDRIPDLAYPPNGANSPDFFKRLSEWWDNTEVRREVIATHESRTWPNWLRRGGDISDQLQAGSDDHWLALLVLGACRRLGRTQESQHRGFLEMVHDRGWWDIFKAPYNPEAWMRMLREWQDDSSSRLDYAQWMSLFPAIYQLSRYREEYARLLRSAQQPEAIKYGVDLLLRPRENPAFRGAGTQFDAPPAPLNMGLHWVLRELVRLGVIEGEHLYPYCWMPSEHVLSILDLVGFIRPDEGTQNPEKARAIFCFMEKELDTASPNLHRAFDIPLRHVSSDPDLLRKFGLE